MDVTLPSGQVITGIPDGTSKEAIMQKAISSGMATQADFAQPSQPQQSPAQPPQSTGAVTGRDYSQPQPNFNADYAEAEEKEKPSMFAKLGNFFSGNLDRTPEMEEMGNLGEVGGIARIMGDASTADKLKFSALNLVTFNPDEVAKIATSMNPDISVIYNKDNNGKVVPILTNQKTGETMLVNDPSIDMGDLGKFAGVGAIFNPAGVVAAAAKGVGKKALVAGIGSAAIQTGIEGAQVVGGGDFNTSDVALSAVGGAVGEAIPIAASAALKKFRGTSAAVDDVAASALTPNQKVRVDSLKKGYEAKKGELTAPQKMDQMKQALAKGEEDKVAAMLEVDEDYLKALKTLGIKEQGLPSTSTNNTQLQQIEQGLKKVPGSENSQIEARQITELSQKADDLIEEFGGNLDKSEAGKVLANKVNSNIEALSQKAEDVYSKIGESIPNTAVSNMDNIGEHLTKELFDLGGDISQLSSLEKRLLAMSKSDTTTYKAVDKLRKEVGAKIGGSSTKFADEDTATLKNLYSLLTEDQEVIAKQFGMGDAWSTGKELVKQRKTLEDNAVKLFGKELNDNVMVKLGNATKKLSKGDHKQFFEIINSVPKRNRKEVIVSALNDVFTMGSRKEKQISTPGFADWYNGLSRNPQLKSALYAYLPPKLTKQLDAMGKVTNNIRNAMAQAPVGGQVMATPGVLNKIMDGISKKILVGVVSKVPGLGIIGDVTEAGLKQGKDKGAEEAMKVLSSPEFVNSIKALAQGQAKKSKALETKLLNRNEAKQWLKTLSKQEQILIGKQGLIEWLGSDTEGEE